MIHLWSTSDPPTKATEEDDEEDFTGALDAASGDEGEDDGGDYGGAKKRKVTKPSPFCCETFADTDTARINFKQA